MRKTGNLGLTALGFLGFVLMDVLRAPYLNLHNAKIAKLNVNVLMKMQ